MVKTTVHEIGVNDKAVLKAPGGTIILDGSGITLKGKVTIKGTLAIESGGGGGNGYAGAPTTGLPLCKICGQE